MAYSYRQAAAAVNLAEGRVPDGDPGPAVAPPCRVWHGQDLLIRQGQRVNPREFALFDAADSLRSEMRNP